MGQVPELHEVASVAYFALRARHLSFDERRKVHTLATSGSDPDTHVLIGNSAPIRALRSEIQDAARSQAKVLLLGETGAGKEVAARLIHKLGARKFRRFVAMNCTGVPDTLLESELFGHLRGSYTGAFRDNPGLARAAEHGTFFLDEVGEMSLRMQAVVLRFVETGEVQPIGASTYSRVDVRLISATNRDLRADVERSTFRQDLYYRLNVIEIRVPALRERADDIDLLLRHYLAMSSETLGLPPPELTAGAEAVLRAYRWPGNVRELKNLAERLVVRHCGQTVQETDLPAELRSGGCGKAHVIEADTSQRSAATSPLVDAVWSRMINGESFWTAAHANFKSHDLTRADLRDLIRRGLEQTQGNYRQLVHLFHMDASDYRRFLSFLSQHGCNLPFQPHRHPAPRATRDDLELERRDTPN